MRLFLYLSALGVATMSGFAVSAADRAPQNPSADDPAKVSPAERLTREALAAELAGDNARRNELLGQALKEDPNCRPARWHSGFVTIDGTWLSIADAANKFAGDRNLAEYRRRRGDAIDAGLLVRGPQQQTTGEPSFISNITESSTVTTQNSNALSVASIAAHGELARWCRTKRLFDEERAHWTQVLRDDPANAEARSRLGLHRFAGQLLTAQQIETLRKDKATEEQQLAHWKAVVSAWRASLNATDPKTQTKARDEMLAVNDPSVIPALESAIANDRLKASAKSSASLFQREAIVLLGRLPVQRATYALAVQAVSAPQSEVRHAAAVELKARPLHDFVPVLLDGLANPVEFESSLRMDPYYGTVNYEAALSQEGQHEVNQRQITESDGGSGIATANFWRLGFQRREVYPLPGVTEAAKTRIVASRARESRQLATAVAQRNEAIAEVNARISAVLETVTGENPARAQPATRDDSEVIASSADEASHESLANSWWNWWANYNEAFVEYPKQVRIVRYSKTDYSPGSFYAVMPSCFCAGTPVTTATGPVAVETLKIGDRVLSQDIDSGELAYKPVLGTTVRPPVESMNVRLGRDTLHTTRGHPFWVVGKGWRMAKELAVGDKVHTLRGSARIESIEKGGSEKAYNLVVADFGTYFVGDGEILVHDTRQRLPSPAILPGYVSSQK